jgi:hypothetical protein
MRHEHPTHQDAAIERRALAEWESLLVRLRAAAAGDLRLERVRHAIARGEFRASSSPEPQGAAPVRAAEAVMPARRPTST